MPQGSVSQVPEDEAPASKGLSEELEPESVLPSVQGLMNGDFEAVRKGKGDPFPTRIFARLYKGDESMGWRVVFGNVERISSRESEDKYPADKLVPASGSVCLDLNGSEPGAISQTFPTRKGQSYEVAFHLSGNSQPDAFDKSPAIKRMAVWTGPYGQGGGVFEFDPGKARNPPEQKEWERRVFQFRADSEKTTLTFASLTPGAGGPMLDGVSLRKGSLGAERRRGERGAPAGALRGADYAMFVAPGKQTREFYKDLQAFCQVAVSLSRGEKKKSGAQEFPSTSDGRSDDAGYGKIFELPASHDGRFRLTGRRVLCDLDHPSANHGVYDVAVEDRFTGKRLPFQQGLFLYYGAVDGWEKPRKCFHWHPSRPVVIAECETGRHRTRYQLWEVSELGLREVPAQENLGLDQAATREGEGAYLNSPSIQGEVFDRIRKAYPKVHFDSSDTREVGAVYIDSTHSYESFNRWEGNEMVFSLGLMAFRLGPDLKPVDLDGLVEGRIPYVPAKAGVPAHFGTPRIPKLPDFE